MVMRSDQLTGFRGIIPAAALAAAIASAAPLLMLPTAWAAETVTYLFPAPPSLPAFGPIRLAKGKGFRRGRH